MWLFNRAIDIDPNGLFNNYSDETVFETDMSQSVSFTMMTDAHAVYETFFSDYMPVYQLKLSAVKESETVAPV